MTESMESIMQFEDVPKDEKDFMKHYSVPDTKRDKT